jgi:hypothetical protein
MEKKKPLVDELFDLITAPVRHSVTRALGRATKPVHARIDRALDQAVRRIAQPVHAHSTPPSPKSPTRSSTTSSSASSPGGGSE